MIFPAPLVYMRKLTPAHLANRTAHGVSHACAPRSHRYPCSYGSIVDIYAPGSSILSAGISGPTSTNTWSGTSMACPHVAGVAAQVLTANPTMAAAAVSQAITDAAAAVVTGVPGYGGVDCTVSSTCSLGFTTCDEVCCNSNGAASYGIEENYNKRGRVQCTCASDCAPRESDNTLAPLLQVGRHADGTCLSGCGTCTDNTQNQGETGVDCGGPCTACDPTCSDGIQNQGEEGIDCGGPCAGVCPPASCSDGVQNQDETDADCGGSICPACATCLDGIQNQDETGVDCGGPNCTPCPSATCADPSPCSLGAPQSASCDQACCNAYGLEWYMSSYSNKRGGTCYCSACPQSRSVGVSADATDASMMKEVREVALEDARAEEGAAAGRQLSLPVLLALAGGGVLVAVVGVVVAIRRLHPAPVESVVGGSMKAEGVFADPTRTTSRTLSHVEAARADRTDSGSSLRSRPASALRE